MPMPKAYDERRHQNAAHDHLCLPVQQVAAPMSIFTPSIAVCQSKTTRCWVLLVRWPNLLRYRDLEGGFPSQSQSAPVPPCRRDRQDKGEECLLFLEPIDSKANPITSGDCVSGLFPGAAPDDKVDHTLSPRRSPGHPGIFQSQQRTSCRLPACPAGLLSSVQPRRGPE